MGTHSHLVVTYRLLSQHMRTVLVCLADDAEKVVKALYDAFSFCLLVKQKVNTAYFLTYLHGRTKVRVKVYRNG